MTLWRRAPREVYRVYGEDEFLSEEGAHANEEVSSPPPAGEQARDSHAARLVGVGLLAGVTAGALGLVVLNASGPHVPPRSALGRGASASVAGHASTTVSANPRPAAHASTGGPVGRRSVVGISNRPAPRVRARARTRGAPGFSTVRHPAARPSSARLFSARLSSARTTVDVDASTAAMAEPAQPRRTNPDAAWAGAQALPIDGEFGFER